MNAILIRGWDSVAIEALKKKWHFWLGMEDSEEVQKLAKRSGGSDVPTTEIPVMEYSSAYLRKYIGSSRPWCVECVGKGLAQLSIHCRDG